MNKTEYLAKRQALMNEAQNLLNSGDTAAAQEKMNMVTELDNKFQAEVTAQANLAALQGNAVVVPAMQNAAAVTGTVEAVDRFDSVEYRQAFMENVCRNVPIPGKFNTAGTTTTTTGAAVIPTTLMSEIIQKMEAYGELYARVRKLNVQGGVQFPILSLKPSASWITETTPSSAEQIQANTSVSFSYYGIECRIAQTLLASVVSLAEFEAMFVPLAVEAIVKALEIAIISGDGSGKMLGVTADSRVPTANVITVSAADFATWSGWKKKVIAKIPKAYRNGCFIMAQGTFDGYIDGMVDTAGQPIGRVNYGIDGIETYRFAGKEVLTVETDVIADYDTASTGDVVAVFLNPTDYAINSNMQMTTVQWTDNDNNQVKTKVQMVVDGKLLDPNGVIVIKKGA